MSTIGIQRSRRRIPTAFCRLGIFVIALTLALSIPLSISDWNFARVKFAAFLASELHRDVQIGALSARLLSMTPTVRIAGLRIGNPEWAADNKIASDFATAKNVIAVLDLRELLRGHLVLEKVDVENLRMAFLRDAEGRDNFSIGDGGVGTQKPDRQLPRLPTIRNLSVRGGSIYVSDQIRKLTFKGTVSSVANEPRKARLHLNGEGTLNDEPFLLSLEGATMIDFKLGRPYDFVVAITGAKINASGRGEFLRPFDPASVTLRLDKPSEDRGRANRLTGLAIDAAETDKS